MNAQSQSPAARTIHDVLINQELDKRIAARSDYAAENKAMAELVEAVPGDPQCLLQKLVERCLQLCHADSAGVSLLEPGRDSHLFHWNAITGQWSSYRGWTLPREASPCGAVLDLKEPLLFQEPAEYFVSARDMHPAIHEILLVPIFHEEQAVGTLWVVDHEGHGNFNREDVRILRNMAPFVSAAYGLNAKHRAMEGLKASRVAALNLMEDAVMAREEAEKAGAALAELEERTRIAVEAAKLGTWEWNLPTGQLIWNAQHFHLVGRKPQENQVPQQKFFDMLDPRDLARVGELLRRTIEQGELFDAEFRVKYPDESVRWVKGYGQVTAKQHGKATRMSGVMFDITERKLLEEERAVLLQKEQVRRYEAEELSQAKDRFLAALSHELRTPLTPVVMIVEHLLHLPGLEDWKDELETVARNVQVERRLIDDLLDLSRIIHRKLEFKFCEVDLNEILQQSVAIVRGDLDEKAQHLSVTLLDTGAMMHGDGVKLQQVFWNLLRNAIKFTPKGGHVSLAILQDDMGYRITVTDTGIGIEAQAFQSIFEAFAQGNAQITRQFGGLGLGLAISKGIVEAHGGRLEASSEGRGKGASFTAFLPCKQKKAET